MRAAPNAVSEFQIPGDEDTDPPLATNVGVTVAAGAAPAVNPNATSAAIASSFRIMNTFCVVLPARTPRQLMIVKTTRTVAARTAARVSFASKFPRAQTYFEKVTATTAMQQLWVTSNMAQP